MIGRSALSGGTSEGAFSTCTIAAGPCRGFPSRIYPAQASATPAVADFEGPQHEAEKQDGKLANVEIATIPMVKDPWNNPAK